MNRDQINQLYAQTPRLLWPWIWVQLIVILARLEAAALRGEDATVLIGVTHWFTLHILYQSDNLSGHKTQTHTTYAGRVTFASLCEGPCAPWALRNPVIFHSETVTSGITAPPVCTAEYEEAVRPVP